MSVRLSEGNPREDFRFEQSGLHCVLFELKSASTNEKIKGHAAMIKDR